MASPRLIMVGGFLGAGKTTLLWEAARRLIRRGMRVGLVTNDQAPELVDTAFLARADVSVSEVAGSCFCCNFQGMLDALSTVDAAGIADVLLAEPVGSCTDLSATIVQPLKDRFRRDFVVAPLSVVADPGRLSDILTGGTSGLHPSAAYIVRKQLEEADLILINKTDLLPPAGLEALKARTRLAFPGIDLLTLSAKTGEDVDGWLDEVMRRTDAGRHLADVDYDVYAEGEAVLGWLNATIVLRGEPTPWDRFVGKFLYDLGRRFARRNAPVGHVKLLLETEAGYLAGNLTGRQDTLNVRNTAGTTSEARLTLNARVQMPPEALDAIVREVLALTCKDRLTATPAAWQCFSPRRPTPTYRYDHVV